MTDLMSTRISWTEESLCRLLVNAITDYAIYMLDPSGSVVSWNPGAERLTGYQTSEILGQHFSVFYIEEDQRQGAPSQALKIAANDGNFETEGWHVRKDGTRFWAHIVIDPIWNQTSQLLGFAKIIRDFSKHRQNQAPLKRTQEEFRLLVQGVTDQGIYLLDPEGNVSSWNIGAERISGFCENEIIGRNFSLFYTKGDREKGEPRRALETAVREGRFEQNGWRIRKDGRIFRANVLISPMRSEDGTIVGFAKVTHDMTDAAKAEYALKTAREALFQSHKMEAIGQLTGGIAHDFSNILTAVLGGLEIVLRRLPEDPNVTPLLENAIRAAQRGTSLTRHMLAFARRREPRPDAVDLPALVVGMNDLIQQSAGPSISIKYCFPSDLKAVFVDTNQLELAVLNLVINGRDAMPDGGSITMSARPGTLYYSDDEYICLSVLDQSDKIDHTMPLMAREPFTYDKETNLGLSMVYGLAEESGGKLIMESRPGEGTITELWLPVAKAAHQAATRVDELVELKENTRPLSVLTVDADPAILEKTTKMLEDLGHWAFGTICAEKALDIVRREKTLDLVILDHAMLNTTRMQLMDTIKSEFPSLQVILSTPLADPSLVRLPKPFDQQELRHAIARTRRVRQKHAMV